MFSNRGDDGGQPQRQFGIDEGATRALGTQTQKAYQVQSQAHAKRCRSPEPAMKTGGTSRTPGFARSIERDSIGGDRMRAVEQIELDPRVIGWQNFYIPGYKRNVQFEGNEFSRRHDAILLVPRLPTTVTLPGGATVVNPRLGDNETDALPRGYLRPNHHRWDQTRPDPRGGH